MDTKFSKYSIQSAGVAPEENLRIISVRKYARDTPWF